MKFYRVICKSVYVEGGEDNIEVRTFQNKDLAIHYLHRMVKSAKQDVEDYDLEKYCVNETETSYERYLDGYASQDNVLIFIQEDDFYDDIELQGIMNFEKEPDYEMD